MKKLIRLHGDEVRKAIGFENNLFVGAGKTLYRYTVGGEWEAFKKFKDTISDMVVYEGNMYIGLGDDTTK